MPEFTNIAKQAILFWSNNSPELKELEQSLVNDFLVEKIYSSSAIPVVKYQGQIWIGISEIESYFIPSQLEVA